MKKLLPLLSFLIFGMGFNTRASHLAGADLSYQHLSANTYRVNMALYRDCASIQLSSSVFVNLQSPGCNNGRNLILNLVSTKTSRPYGPAIPVTCTGSSVYPNYEIGTYSGILTFSTAETSCADWVLSWSECCRVSFGNITGQPALYTEARLKLMPGLINSSPAFDTLQAPVLYVNSYKDYALSMAATDPNGDSLVYSLVAPLVAANTPVTYTTIPLFPNVFINNPNPQLPYSNPFNPQIAQLNGTLPQATYLPTYPMLSIMVNWASPPTVPYPTAPGGMIWAANHFFYLDAATGKLKFNTSYYDNISAPIQGKNKYLFTVQVEEYRKINGVTTKLSTIRRETMIQVFDGSVNLNPVFARIAANNQVLTGNNQIFLRPGTPLTLQFSATDSDSTDVVNLATNATSILPGSVFTILTNGNTTTGTITWVPTAAHIRDQNYNFQLNIRDNANPLRGVTSETIAVKVRASGGVTGVSKSFEPSEFTAFPNPFSEELNFNLSLTGKAESIVIYNLLGQQVDAISLKTLGIGEQKVQWPNAGKHAAGTYVARLISANKTLQTLKFTKTQ